MIAFGISAEINKNDLENLFKTYSRQLLKKAIRSALDRTGTWGKKYLVEDVTENYNLSSAKIRRAIEVKRTTQDKLEVSLKIRGPGLSILRDFNAWQDRIGIKANIKKAETYNVPHAFINLVGLGLAISKKYFTRSKTGSGFVNIVAPKKTERSVIMMRIGKSRYPTTGKPGRGPSIPMLVNRLSNRAKRDRDLQDHLYKELADQISKRTMGESQIIEIE